MSSINTGGSPPGIVVAKTTAFLSILPFDAAVLADLLDRGYELSTAMAGASLVGAVMAVIAYALIGQGEINADSGGTQPPLAA